MSTAAVIAAAGLSSRMRDFKPLLCLGSSTVIGHTIDALRTAGAAPVNAQCEGITLVLEQRAHDSARRAHSAECGGYYRGRLVQPFDLPYDISCINSGT